MNRFMKCTERFLGPEGILDKFFNAADFSKHKGKYCATIAMAGLMMSVNSQKLGVDYQPNVAAYSFQSSPTFIYEAKASKGGRLSLDDVENIKIIAKNALSSMSNESVLKMFAEKYKREAYHRKIDNLKGAYSGVEGAGIFNESSSIMTEVVDLVKKKDKEGAIEKARNFILLDFFEDVDKLSRPSIRKGFFDRAGMAKPLPGICIASVNEDVVFGISDKEVESIHIDDDLRYRMISKKEVFNEFVRQHEKAHCLSYYGPVVNKAVDDANKELGEIVLSESLEEDEMRYLLSITEDYHQQVGEFYADVAGLMETQRVMGLSKNETLRLLDDIIRYRELGELSGDVVHGNSGLLMKLRNRLEDGGVVKNYDDVVSEMYFDGKEPLEEFQRMAFLSNVAIRGQDYLGGLKSTRNIKEWIGLSDDVFGDYKAKVLNSMISVPDGESVDDIFDRAESSVEEIKKIIDDKDIGLDRVKASEKNKVKLPVFEI